MNFFPAASSSEKEKRKEIKRKPQLSADLLLSFVVIAAQDRFAVSVLAYLASRHLVGMTVTDAYVHEMNTSVLIASPLRLSLKKRTRERERKKPRGPFSRLCDERKCVCVCVCHVHCVGCFSILCGTTTVNPVAALLSPFLCFFSFPTRSSSFFFPRFVCLSRGVKRFCETTIVVLSFLLGIGSPPSMEKEKGGESTASLRHAHLFQTKRKGVKPAQHSSDK